MVDNADDAGVDGRLRGEEGETCFLAAYEEHVFADPRADGINGDQRSSSWLAVRTEWLNQEELRAGQRLVFASGDDIADDTGEMHGRVA
jgi:hypothetical protein